MTWQPSINKASQIVVIGAGYAGLMAALRLAGKTRHQPVTVTLVNAVDEFIQRPRTHEAGANQPVPTRPLSDLLRGTSVRFVRGWVSALEPAAHTVRVETAEGPQALPYDQLVYALGSVVDRDSVPGVREYAYVLNPHGTRGAAELGQRLYQLAGTAAQIVVVGGGPTGLEGATEIKARYPSLSVSLVTAGELGQVKGPRVEPHLRQALHQQDIAVMERRPVTAVQTDRIVLADGQTLPFEVCVWAGGFAPLPLAREAGLSVNKRGQILVDPYGRSQSHPDIYAVGDAAQPIEEPGYPARMSLLYAITSGANVADNLVALIQGKRQNPLSFAYYGQAIALGPHDAVGFNGYPDDQPHGPILRGRLAVTLRRFFVWLLAYILEVERRWPGFYFWLGQGRYAAAKRATEYQRPMRV